jgi:fatty acid desaturase
LGLTQYSGLVKDLRDPRLNTRTLKLNPFVRFLYFNMNYHIEHHMFPMVPFHSLPKLHERIKQDLPRAYDGLIDVYKEIVPALLRQSHDAEYFLVRELPGQGPSEEKSRPFTELKTQ